MNEKDFLLAGKITSKVREDSRKLIVAGAKYADIADEIEGMIIKLGARPAFPVNISANEIAAHDTARPNDDRELKNGDVVKIDLGASVNGWAGDTAYTVEINTDKHKKMIEACEEALRQAIKTAGKGVELRAIGKKIEETTTKAGYNPIRNLGGHPLDEYQLHGDFIIPNYDNHSTQKLEAGGIAIEPFITTGEGWVEDAQEMLIYCLERPKPVRNMTAREILKFITKNYNTMPFAERWIAKEFKHYEYALRVLLEEGVIHGYKKLREQSKGIVAQAEHSLLINDKTIVTTI
ncbi:MAG: type II methionyl aminopeptidase [Candidatus Nanoarchaeia archaeon]